MEAFVSLNIDIPYRGLPMYPEDRLLEESRHPRLGPKLDFLDTGRALPDCSFLSATSSANSRSVKRLTPTQSLPLPAHTKKSLRHSRSGKPRAKIAKLSQAQATTDTNRENDNTSENEQEGNLEVFCPRCAGIDGYDAKADKLSDYSTWYECSGCSYGVPKPSKRPRRDRLMSGPYTSPGPDSSDEAKFAARHPD